MWAGDWVGAVDEENGDPTTIQLALDFVAGAATAEVNLGDGEPLPSESVDLSRGFLRIVLNGEAGPVELSLRPGAGSGALEGEVVRPVAGPPATNVHLARVDRSGERWKLVELRNLTDRDAYDNQPRFTRDGGSVLYTAAYGDQTEINAFDLGAGETWRLTDTPEGEYSPTPLPGLTSIGFSTVRTALDGTQRLWAWRPADRTDAEPSGGEPRDGGPGDWTPSLLLPQVEPVGYHGWIDEDTAALFVLGEPPTLQLARVPREGELASPARLLAAHIGRSIHRVPDREAVSFVFKESADRWWIRVVDLQSLETRSLIETPSGNEDFIWLRDGRLLSATGATLMVADPAADFPQWTPVLDLSQAGLGTLSRLAEHPSDELLAVVAERPEAAPRQSARPVVLTRVESAGDR